MQSHTAQQHQEQEPFAKGDSHALLQVGRGRAQAQFHRAVRTGLNAGEAKHAIAIVFQVGWMGPQGAASRGQAFTFRWSAFEAGITAATAAAGARLGPQLQHR